MADNAILSELSQINLDNIQCKIDEKGITRPDFANILDWLQNTYREIYGDDIVLESSTQDGQWLAILALAIHNCNNMAVSIFNCFSPATAQGVALSNAVKINGITRKIASNSTCDIIINGKAGTQIINGAVADINNVIWQLPNTVVIPTSGNIMVTATCSQIGAVTAAPNTLTVINTPTRGWESVDNPRAAIVGLPIETDAQLRSRQAISTMLPSQTVMDGIVGAIRQLPNVQRVSYIENDTASTDPHGIPAHAIVLIVEGGDAQQIARVIFLKKTAGTPTWGNVNEQITDAMGHGRLVSFSRPNQVNVYVNVTIEIMDGYTSGIGDSIGETIANYIQNLTIGSKIFVGRVIAQANLPFDQGGQYYSITEISLGLSKDSLQPTDLTLGYLDAPNCRYHVAADDTVAINIVPQSKAGSN